MSKKKMESAGDSNNNTTITTNTTDKITSNDNTITKTVTNCSSDSSHTTNENADNNNNEFNEYKINKNGKNNGKNNEGNDERNDERNDENNEFHKYENNLKNNNDKQKHISVDTSCVSPKPVAPTSRSINRTRSNSSGEGNKSTSTLSNKTNSIPNSRSNSKTNSGGNSRANSRGSSRPQTPTLGSLGGLNTLRPMTPLSFQVPQSFTPNTAATGGSSNSKNNTQQHQPHPYYQRALTPHSHMTHNNLHIPYSKTHNNSYNSLVNSTNGSTSGSTTSLYSLQSMHSLSNLQNEIQSFNINGQTNINNHNNLFNNYGSNFPSHLNDTVTSPNHETGMDKNVISSGIISQNLRTELENVKRERRRRKSIIDYSDTESEDEHEIKEENGDRSNSNESDKFSIVSSNHDVYENTDVTPPTSTDVQPYSTTSPSISYSNKKYIIILTGLPASGKSTLCKSLIDYLHNNRSNTSKDLKIEIFNAGKIRRSDSVGKFNTMLKLANNSNEDLFNPKNSKKKEIYAKLALSKLFNKIDDLDIAIFDATNSTPARRALVIEEINNHIVKTSISNSDISFVPIILQIQCFNKNFIKYNVHNKTFNEDYFDKPYSFALKDFAKRLKYYQSQYVSMSVEEMNDLKKLIAPDLPQVFSQEMKLSSSNKTLNSTDFKAKNAKDHDDLYFISITNGDKNYFIYEHHDKVNDYGSRDLSVEEDEIIRLIKKFVQTYYDSNINKTYTTQVQDFFKNELGDNTEYIEKLNELVLD